MLLYIMLYKMLAYIKLFTALVNAVCSYNAYLFLAIDFYKWFLFSCFVFGLLSHSLPISIIILHHVQCF